MTLWIWLRSGTEAQKGQRSHCGEVGGGYNIKKYILGGVPVDLRR